MKAGFALFCLVPLLAACGDAADAPQDEPTRILLENAEPPEARALASPDTSDAFWQVAESGQAVNFGNEGEAPLLTLACDLADDTPPQFVIIRHAEALPGQEALFPFVGNGMSRRFLADTVLVDGEWRWEARLPASSAQLEIFEGSRGMFATLPGRGTLEMRGSRIPGEFLAWCRAGGELPDVEDSTEDATEAAG